MMNNKYITMALAIILTIFAVPILGAIALAVPILATIIVGLVITWFIGYSIYEFLKYDLNNDKQD